MTHEESKVMWKLEIENVKALEESGKEISESLQTLINLVDELINNDKLLYSDYINDVIDVSTTVLVDSDDETDRRSQVDTMCNKLIEKYSKLKEDGQITD